MDSKIIFITGTDTYIGKTTVTALLTKVLSRSGQEVGILKPIETGCTLDSNMNLFPEDANYLWEISGKKEKLEDIILYRFSLPLAPAVSEKIEGKEVDLKDLKDFIFNKASKKKLTLVETAGGLLVPIKGSYSSADLIKDCNASCLLVIGNRLGCINHASLTFEVLKNRGIKIIGYVLNDFIALDHMNSYQEAAFSTNREIILEIAKKYQVKELAHLPFFTNLEAEDNLENLEIQSLKNNFLASLIETP